MIKVVLTVPLIYWITNVSTMSSTLAADSAGNFFQKLKVFLQKSFPLNLNEVRNKRCEPVTFASKFSEMRRTNGDIPKMSSVLIGGVYIVVSI